MNRLAKVILPIHLIKTTFIVLLLTINIAAQTVKIKVIQTTDEHGAIFPFDFTEMKETNNSLATVYSFVKEERAKKDQEVILVSGGDILQGTPAVYYFNYEETNAPHLYAEVVNYMKYDAAAVGNHDIETGHPVYDRFNKQIKFPWLAANAVNQKTKKPYFSPYTIIKKGGIKIAILGLITPHIPNWLPQNIWKGIYWEDMIECAKKWVKIINEKEKPDLLIGLFHSGVDFTYSNQNAETYKNENAARLTAEQVPGFDIVYVGHDHRGWNFETTNSIGKKVLILGATNSARDVTVANCTFTYNPNEKKWTSEIKGETVESKNYKPNQEFMSKFSKQFEEVKKYVSRPIGTFTKPITSRESLFGPSTFSDVINQVQLDLTNADISFTAPLSMNSTIEAGEILVGEMFRLYRYENFLYTMELTGREIKDYLEYSYNLCFKQMKNSDDNLLNFGFDDKGNVQFDRRSGFPMLKNQYYNFDCAAGINYTVDVSKPFGQRVTINSMVNGTEFKFDKKYKVAVNSYRGNGGGGHLINGAGIAKEDLEKRIIKATDKDFRYYMMKWVEKKKTVNPTITGNWKVIPEEWWQKGKEKDYKLLFKN